LSGNAENFPFIRDSVAQKYARIQKKLKPMGLTLKITFGYRPPALQAQYHDGAAAFVRGDWESAGKIYTGADYAGGTGTLLRDETHFDDMDLHAAAEVFAAYPPVAGHTTGGATDTIIARLSDGAELPFSPPTEGMDSAEEAAVMSTFGIVSLAGGRHPAITDEMFANRMFLHDLMVEQGFAPFYGEWWHFMYGDREWAAFMGEPAALYGPGTRNNPAAEVVAANLDLSVGHALPEDAQKEDGGCVTGTAGVFAIMLAGVFCIRRKVF
jgi:D-alanyl-D-alanine dipeptidase